MWSRLLNVESSRSAARQIFGYVAMVHWGTALCIVVAAPWNRLALSVLVFIAVTGLLSRWRRYQQTSFGLIVSVLTCVYYVVPLGFLVVMGESYDYGGGVSPLPGTNAEYAATAPLAVFALSGFFVVLAAGLCLVGSRGSGRSRDEDLWPMMPVGLLGLVVVFLTQQGTSTLLATRSGGDEVAESLWQFIFFDHAYLMLMPVLLFSRLTRPDRHRSGLVAAQFLLILLLLLLQATVGSTSKGFILTLAVLSFVIPYAYLQKAPGALCLFPSRTLTVAAAVLSVVVFFVAEGLRVNVFSGTDATIGETLEALDSSASRVLTSVGYRLAAGVDRYILIFQAFVVEGSAGTYAQEFMTYVGKSFLNLVLPGTPYLEAYIPSSNLLPAVLSRSPLMGEASKAQLLLSLNTQPFTIFGLCLIVGGWFAPALVFLFGAVVAILNRLVTAVWAQLGLLYFVFMANFGYGGEVVIANAMHAAVSLFIFLSLMRVYVRLRGLSSPRPDEEAVRADASSSSHPHVTQA